MRQSKHNAEPRLAVRWYVGNVSALGFEALRLSIHGAWRLFGRAARYVVCVNTIAAFDACARVGTVPAPVEWRAVERDDMPAFLRPHFDDGLAEGVGWKLMPLRIQPDLPELALDNDCILWSLPAALARWLDDDGDDVRVIAEDVTACFGQFGDLVDSAPRNSGLRALPSHFDLATRLRAVLTVRNVTLKSELDEQGLQVAAISCDAVPLVVRLDEVSICSPFPPHQPTLGSCGAHFVGLNVHDVPWSHDGRPAVDLIREHFSRWRPELTRRVMA